MKTEFPGPSRAQCSPQVRVTDFLPISEIARQSGLAVGYLKRYFIPPWHAHGLAVMDAYDQWWVDPSVIESIGLEKK